MKCCYCKSWSMCFDAKPYYNECKSVCPLEEKETELDNVSQGFSQGVEKMREIEIDSDRCNRDIRTYGDVIRHMDNWELAILFEEMQADIELGILAVMRAKMYYHRHRGEEPLMDKGDDRHTMVSHFNSFMEHRLKYEDENYADVWGVKNWQDLMQWEIEDKKNFGMDVVY